MVFCAVSTKTCYIGKGSQSATLCNTKMGKEVLALNHGWQHRQLCGYILASFPLMYSK